MPAIALLTFVAVQAQSMNAIVDAACRKLDSMASFAVEVDVTTTSGRNSYKSHYDIWVARPNALLMRITEPQQGGKSATDRSYRFKGAELLAVDHRAREYLRRRISASGPMYLRVANALGRMGEAFEMAISGERAKFILAALGEGHQWTRMGDKWQAAGQASSITVTFAGGLIKSVSIASKEGTSRWLFSYGPARGTMELSVPKGFRFVTSFVERTATPKFASPASRKLYERAQATYQKMAHVDMVTTLDRGEKVRIRYSGRLAREDWLGYSWTYDGRTLTIIDYRRKIVYKGNARGSQVIEMLANAGCPMHPFTRAAFRKQNWLSTILTDDMSLDSAGTMSILGVKYEILSFKGPTFRGSMQIEARTGRVAEVTLKQLSRSGSVISVTESTYRFKSVGKPIGTAEFKIASPTGFVVKPVGPLKDKQGS